MLRIIKTIFNTFVDWTNIVNKPTTFAPSSHGSSAHSETYLTAETDPIATGALNSHKTSADHDGRYYTETETNNLLAYKIDKVIGKDLSTNDYTTAEQSKVGYINVTGAINLDTIDGHLNQSVKTTASPSFAGLAVNTSLIKTDTANNRVGINTTSPSRTLHVVNKVNTGDIIAIEGYKDNTSAVTMTGYKARGSSTSPVAANAWDGIFGFNTNAWNGTGWANCGYFITTLADVAPSAGDAYAKATFTFALSPNTTTAPANVLIISGDKYVQVNGHLDIVNTKATNQVLSSFQQIAGQTGDFIRYKNSSGSTLVKISATGLIFPVQAATASAPAYVKGGMYFDTTLNKLRIGGATAWETVTSA